VDVDDAIRQNKEQKTLNIVLNRKGGYEGLYG
jgi:hypothetical protein